MTNRSFLNTLAVSRKISISLRTKLSFRRFSYRERIRLDVSGLSAGQYSVEVNGAVATLNLMENH